jgi:hypothetical protein
MRKDRMLKLRKQGKTYQQIANKFRVSKQRIHQLIGKIRRPVVPGLASRNAVLYVYKYGAKGRKLAWKISGSAFNRLCEGNCHYCGLPPSNVYRAKGGALTPFTYSGLDRQDNSKGYIEENVVSCCKLCNRAKRDMSLVEWNEWLTRIRTKKLTTASIKSTMSTNRKY